MAQGLLKKEDFRLILSLLETFGFDLACPFTVEQMLSVMLSDKKRAGATVTLVMPFAIGRCELVKVKVEDLADYIKKGMEE